MKSGRCDKPDHPPADHHSFDEHETIVAAIADRNRDAAYQAMYDHLVHVRDNLTDSRPPRQRQSA